MQIRILLAVVCASGCGVLSATTDPNDPGAGSPGSPLPTGVGQVAWTDNGMAFNGTAAIANLSVFVDMADLRPTSELMTIVGTATVGSTQAVVGLTISSPGTLGQADYSCDSPSDSSVPYAKMTYGVSTVSSQSFSLDDCVLTITQMANQTGGTVAGSFLGSVHIDATHVIRGAFSLPITVMTAN